MIDFQQIKSITGSVKSQADLAAYLAKEYAGDVEAFMDAIDEGLNELLKTDRARAEEFVAVAQPLADLLAPEWQPRFVSLRARLALNAGRAAEARDLYLRALGLFNKHRNFASAARLRKGLVEAYKLLGETDAAITEGKKALAYFRRKGWQVDEAKMLTNLGNIYHHKDQNRQALRYYEKAREVFAREGGLPVAIVEFNLANIYTNLNDLQRAKKLYASSLAFYEQSGFEIYAAQARYSLAYLAFLESHYALALEGFENVYDTFVRLKDRVSAATTLLDLVELEVHLHLFGSAVHLGLHVIEELRAMNLSYEEGKANYFVAAAMIELQEKREARKYLKRARSIFEASGNNLWLGMVLLASARLSLQEKRIPAALDLTREAEAFFARSGDKRRMNDARLLRLETIARSEEASRLLSGAVKQLRAAGLVKYQQYQLATTLGDYYMRRKKHGDAVREYRAALKNAEEMLYGLNQDEIRVLFASDVTESYNRLAQAYLAEKKDRSALIEVLRGMAVLNLQSTRISANAPRGSLHKQIDSLRSQIAMLHRLKEGGGSREVAASRYRDLEQKLWRLQRSARGHITRGDDPTNVTVSDIEEILDKLGDRTLVHYHRVGDQIGAFVADSSGVRYSRLQISFSEFQTALRKTYFLLEQGITRRSGSAAATKALTHYRRLLYDQIVAPLFAEISTAPETILAVDREFLQVPFATLLDEAGVVLQDKLEFSVIVNPLDIKRSGASWNPRGTSAIIGVDSESLPLVRNECQAIRSNYRDAEYFMGEAATTTSVGEALRKCSGFVHIAAHASRASENPLFSRILLADGPLFPFEVNGTIRAGLVTLSGCQTAAPGLYYGNSFSLAKAFYQAGGRAVLASQWSVADDVTMEFMTEFYKVLGATKSIRKAFLRAVSKIRMLTDNPAHWGAFVLLGGVT